MGFLDLSNEPLVPPIDMAVLTIRLQELLDNYRDALRIVSRLPRVGRWPVQTIRREPGSATEISTSHEGSRWVVRPFVRFFVELHIRRKLKSIEMVLRIEEMVLDPKSSDENKTLKSYTKQLQALRGIVTRPGRIPAFLSKAPLIPFFVPLITALVLQLSGIDVSDGSALGVALVKLGQAGRWTAPLRLLLLIGILVIYLYIIFVPVVVGIGFRGKRAIFAGGETIKDLFEWNPFVRESERWLRLPQTNIYQTENHLFQTLRVPKPREFPLDLVAILIPYFSLVVAVIFSIEAISTFRAGGHIGTGTVIGVLLFWTLVIYFLVGGIGNYRKRVEARDM